LRTTPGSTASSPSTAPFTQSRSAHLHLACAIAVAVIAVVADRHGRRPQGKILLFGLGLMGTLPMETPLLSLLVLALITRRVPAGTWSGADWAIHLLLPLAITVTRIDRDERGRFTNFRLFRRK
jgi:MFS family permease